MFRSLNSKEGVTDNMRERRNHILDRKQICRTVQLEHVFPGAGGKKENGSRGGKGKTGNHLLWKYNIKQALKFPENVGIKLNTGKEFLP